MSRDAHEDFPDLLSVDPDDVAAQAAIEDAETIEGLTQGLYQRRKQRGHTQREVGEYVGLGQSSISDIDRGCTDPSLSVLMLYARAVGCRLGINLDGRDVRHELSDPRSLDAGFVPDNVAPVTRRAPSGWLNSRAQGPDSQEHSWSEVKAHG